LIVSDISNPFFAEIIPAIEERLGVEGFVVFVGNTSEDRKKEERLLAKIREFPPDGVLICPALGDVESSGGTPTLAGRLPIVAFARRAPGLDYAGVDNAQGAQLAVEHLYQLGYQRIAFIGGNPNSSAGQERVEGYQRALTRSGLQFDPLLVIASAPTRRGGYDSVQRLLQIEDRPTAALCFNDVVALGVIDAIQERVEGYRKALIQCGLEFDPLLVIPSAPTRRGGFDSVQRLLQIADRPAAALCFNDVVALGVIEALQLAGIKVGSGFGVVGFNNIPDAAYSFPGLTTVDTSPRLLGETAAELLLKRIEQPDSPTRTVILQPRLIIRQSCAVRTSHQQ